MAAKPPMVEFKNVSKIYPGGKVAVENINLRIERGEFVCLSGPLAVARRRPCE